MATNQQMDEPSDINDSVRAALNAVDMHYDESNPGLLIAALLIHDELSGLQQADDRIVVSPGLGMWIPGLMDVTAPPRLVELIGMPEEDLEDPNGALEAEFTQLFGTWFEVTFTPGEPGGPQWPSQVDGRKVSVRLMTDEESGRSDFFAASVRAEGGGVVAPVVPVQQPFA